MARGQLTPGLREHRPPEREPVRAVGPWCWPAWLAGCNLRYLAQNPSVVTFFNALGIAVGLLSGLSGFVVCFAVSYALKEPGAAIAVGIAWLIVMSCAIERLLLQVIGSRTHPGALVVAVIPRVLVSVLIGFVLAEPLLLKLNEREINNHIQKTQQAEKRQLINGAEATYETTIAAKKKELEELKDQVGKIKGRFNELAAKSGCAVGVLRSCAKGGAGCDAECQTAAGNALREAGTLREVRAVNVDRRPALEQSLGNWREKRGGDETGGRGAIEESDGLLARIEALHALAGEHGAAFAEVWLLTLFFICLDLLPLGIKVTRILSGKCPYEMDMAAARNRDALSAEAQEAATDVARQQITEQARADKRVMQAKIAADTERRMYEASGDAVPDYVPTHLVPTEPISAMPLDEFVENIEHYETRVVDVPDELRRSALIGFALIGAALTTAFLLTSVVGVAVAGAWLLMIAFGLATTLGIYTHGFRQAPAWAMRLILATFVAGLALPPFVLLLNVAV